MNDVLAYRHNKDGRPFYCGVCLMGPTRSSRCNESYCRCEDREVVWSLIKEHSPWMLKDNDYIASEWEAKYFEDEFKRLEAKRELKRQQLVTIMTKKERHAALALNPVSELDSYSFLVETEDLTILDIEQYLDVDTVHAIEESRNKS